MKQVSVSFSTGKDVLNSYWGFLSNGGLVIPEAGELIEGDAVALEVTIESSRQQYRLQGHVVKGPSAPSLSGKAVIAFHPGEPHDLLLSAAWAETDNVPARKARRLPVDLVASVRYPSGEGEGRAARLLNLSVGGCCLRLAGESAGLDVKSGDHVDVTTNGLEARGVVRWRRASDLGIQFDDGVKTAPIEAYLRKLEQS